MMNRESWTVALLAFFTPMSLFAAQGPLAFSVDEKTQSYTITEDGRPVLTYRFGEVPLPAGVEAHHFSKRDTPYDGAYFSCDIVRWKSRCPSPSMVWPEIRDTAG